MKFLFANNYFFPYGGTERVFFDEIRILKQKGHDIIPFSRKHADNVLSPYSEYFSSPLEYYNAGLWDKFISMFKLIYSFENMHKLDSIIQLYSPDVFHVHTLYGRLTTSVIDSARHHNVPVVMTLHDYKLTCPTYLMLRNNEICNKCNGTRYFYCTLYRCHKKGFSPSIIYTIESYFNRFLNKYKWVNYFICPSRFLLEVHDDAGIERNKLIHIPNFILIDDFLPNFTPGGYILFIGRIAREKGLLTLIKAVRGLEVELKVVGEGEMSEYYRNYVKDNNITNVSFEGHKYGGQLELLYRDSSFV
ncbi:MAG: glycosyltransferase, partial [Candidatus Thorarchaeota archaeon]